MRILLEKMVFDHPGMVVAAAVRGLQLRQRILVELEFIAGFPRARQLQLIKDAEFHDVSLPRSVCCFAQCIAGRGRVPPWSIPRGGRRLALTSRMVSLHAEAPHCSAVSCIDISCPPLRRSRTPR